MTVIHSYGHSCFSVRSDDGWTAVFDPYEDGSVPGLKLPPLSADAVYTSHDHADHNAKHLVSVKEVHSSPYKLRTMLTDHDEEGGRLRGKNRITLLLSREERIAHFGDLGRDLTREEAEALYGMDAIMIPCGGYYTIDAAQAKRIIDLIQPKLAILMHYRTASSGYDVLADEAEVKRQIPEARFLKECEAVIGRETGVIALSAGQ